jgi:hypothetical protein
LDWPCRPVRDSTVALHMKREGEDRFQALRVWLICWLVLDWY